MEKFYIASTPKAITFVPKITTPNTSVPNTTAPNTSVLNTTIPNCDPMIIEDTNPIELKSPKKEKHGNDEPLNFKKEHTRNSDVWDHFTKVKCGNPEEPRCKCNYCGKDYACHTTRVGTSSLWVHLKKCKKNSHKTADKKKRILSFKSGVNGDENLLVATFNNVRCRNALAKFVVKDEQAFNVIEGEGFKDLINELQPRFIVLSRMTITRDIYTLFYNERSKLMKELTTAGQ